MMNIGKAVYGELASTEEGENPAENVPYESLKTMESDFQRGAHFSRLFEAHVGRNSISTH